ncbi:MAG: hypothetical protein AB7F79_02290 [Steroidobacteraceae bacterium]
MNETERLVSCLWALFSDEIASGDPVFFCFSQETLADQLKLHGFVSTSPLDTVCTVARRCYEVEGDFAFLMPETLTAGPDGRSMAIILICQQVLAVEQMVHEGTRYSENSYFPRLRELMSTRLPLLHSNPFYFREFESIWQTFAREIVRTAGGSNESITFEFGAYSGVNKARLFPMSQALFSKSDLQELLKQCQSNRLRGGSVRQAWDEIRRERNHLTRRGQRLVNTGFLRERLIEQVQRYARRVDTTSTSTLGQLTQKPLLLDLAIALDAVDWLSEAYIAFLVERGGTRKVDAPDLLKAKLEAVLIGRGYAFFALSDFGDYWLFREAATEAVPGDALLLVGTMFDFHRGVALLDGLAPPVAVDESRVSTLTGAPQIRVCQVTLPKNLDCRVELRSGHLLKDDTNVSVQTKYEWIGGICVDLRAHKYLRGFLPKSIRFGMEFLVVESLRRVNGILMSWTNLVRTIDSLDADASYDLQFANGHSAKLAIGIERLSERAQMGFLLNRDGMLSPTLEQIVDLNAAVVGFSQPSDRIAAAATTSQVARLLHDLSRCVGRPISPEERSRLVAAVSRSPAPDSVMRLVLGLMKAGAMVSERTLSEFL